MASFDYDVIVIGSGAGGIVSARLLAKAGKSVAIVESGKLGGECPNFACIPTKALLESARLYHSARSSDKLGLRGSAIGFSYPRIKAWKNKAVSATGVEKTEQSLHLAGINVIHGSAHFIDERTLTVGRARFKAKQFIVATGSEPIVLNIPGLIAEDFLTYKEALELSRPPKSIAIIGGGAVGIEFATIFGSFGSKVYLVEKSAHLLSVEESLVGDTLKTNLESQYDVSCIEKATLQSGAKRGNKKQLILKVAGKLHTIVVDEVMMAVGKKPNTDIGLENAGIKYKSSGIDVNHKLQTSSRHIFAVGDVLGGNSSTHLSTYQGRLAARNILKPKKTISVDYRAVPRTVFSSPEVACVGLSQSEQNERKLKTKSATVDLKLVGKSNVSPSANGFVKVTVDTKTTKIISASIVSLNATEIIHELTLAIQAGLTAGDIANTIHAFPTWSEAVRVACTKLAVS